MPARKTAPMPRKSLKTILVFEPMSRQFMCAGVWGAYHLTGEAYDILIEG